MSTAVAPSRLERYDGAATSTVDRFEWCPVDVPAVPIARCEMTGRRVLVLGGEPGHRLAVRDALAAANAVPLVLDAPDDGEPEILADAVRAAVAGLGRVDGIVDLNVEPDAAVTSDRWRAALVRTTAAVQAVYDDWAAETAADRCFYLAVTWMGGRMGYDRQRIRQPLGGVWAGFGKSIPHELPACRVKVLDLDGGEAAELGRRVADEAAASDFYEVGWYAGQRCTLGASAVACPPPRLRLGPDDVVLVSGGGRGVGFAFARRLARDVGCRVVVTGRDALPVDAPELRMDEAAYADLRRQQLRDAAAAGGVGSVRRQHQRWDALRGLAANLADVAAEGLPVEYRVCDFLDADAVQRLVDDLGPRLRVVVHNAGIAAPTRLRSKAPETVLRVVESKLVSFVNLAAAVRGRPLDYFCNVGSVAGRMGGMAGQIDYAGANEVLSRLGFWAQQVTGLPVATLCWTTWEQVGLIANYEAALRYGAALRVEEGVSRWVDELLAAEPTEAMFLGRVGTALAPTQIRGFLEFTDHPDLPWLLSRQHYLGTVQRYAPFRLLHATAELVPAQHPCCRDAAIVGRPMLPLSVALEYAVSAGDWLPPEGWPLVHLTELRDVTVDLRRLALPDGPTVQLSTRADAGRDADGAWTVRVSLAVSRSGEDVPPALAATLVYAEDPRRESIPAPRSEPPTPLGKQELPVTWSGLVFPRPAWCTDGVHLVAGVSSAYQADAWALPSPPLARLPAAAVEAVLEGMLRTSGNASALRLELTTVRLASTGRPEAHVSGTPGEGSWRVTDEAGDVLLDVMGGGLRE